jgi:hypothetical protein
MNDAIHQTEMKKYENLVKFFQVTFKLEFDLVALVFAMTWRNHIFFLQVQNSNHFSDTNVGPNVSQNLRQ